MSAWLYLPDDEPDQWTVAGETYHLEPNKATEIVSKTAGVTSEAVADQIVANLGKWGVCRVSGPLKNKLGATQEDREAIATAEKEYIRNTHAWAEEVVLADFTARKPFLDASLLGPPMSEETKKAKAWLRKYGSKVEELV